MRAMSGTTTGPRGQPRATQEAVTDPAGRSRNAVTHLGPPYCPGRPAVSTRAGCPWEAVSGRPPMPVTSQERRTTTSGHGSVITSPSAPSITRSSDSSSASGTGSPRAASRSGRGRPVQDCCPSRSQPGRLWTHARSAWRSWRSSPASRSASTTARAPSAASTSSRHAAASTTGARIVTSVT